MSGDVVTPTPDYRTLPEPIGYDDMVATEPVTDAPDPEMGRDTDKEFMLRYM